MQKVGIIGGGKRVQSHIESIRKIPNFEIAGIFDFDKSRKNPDQVPTFTSMEELVEHSDIVDITASGMPHFEMASLALRKSKHVFIDRPLVSSLPEANKLLDLAFEANVKVQIGHMERFKPAFVSAYKYINQPNYIESHRTVAISNPPSKLHVVMDMMIQDIDIVLSIVDSGIKRINARSYSIDANDLLMVNAHIVFDNGCIANLTSSKMTENDGANIQIYQDNESLNIDLLNNKAQRFNGFDSQYILGTDNPSDSLKNELESFNHSICNNTTPYISLLDGSNALELAIKILDKVEYWQDIHIKESSFGRG